jgi:AhpD family alkylhydroperoxidase
MSFELYSDLAQVAPLERHRVVPSSTNLSLVDESTASREVRALFAQCRERFARTDLPGIVLCFATNSVLLKGMLEIAENLLFGDSLLSRRQKEMIATYVSRQNACPYCADSHGACSERRAVHPK